MTLPRLHVVTDDDVLAEPGFRDTAAALIEAHGPALALHVRSPSGPVRRLLETTEALVDVAGEAGALLLVNDRPDVALAAGAVGVQLGRRSLPVQAARRILGDGAVIGCSTHSAAEAVSAAENGADFVVLGTIWATPSHPDREGAGLAPVRSAAADTPAPIVAIGGVTPDRAAEAVAAGAWGAAVIRGVWHAADPVGAAAEYLQVMGMR